MARKDQQKNWGNWKNLGADRALNDALRID